MRDFRARMSDIPEVMGFLNESFEESSASQPGEAMLFDLRLTVTEAFANIVEHSYGNEPDRVIRVLVEITSAWLEIIFEDFGRRPDPRRLRWRDLGDYRERGLGLFLMSKCMDEVEFTFRADGMNCLRARRFFERRENAKHRVHLPFHLAIYEMPAEERIYPIGHLEGSRRDLLEARRPAKSRTVTLDLSGLDFVDASGLARIANFFDRVRDVGGEPRLTRPPAHLAHLFQESPFMARIAPRGWVEGGDVSGVDPCRPVGRYLPLIRAFGPYFFPAAPPEIPGDSSRLTDFMGRLAPERFAFDGFRGEFAMRWGTRSRCHFFRAIPPPFEDAAALLFIGAFARPGVRAIIGSAQLYAALGAFPRFARRRHQPAVHDFIRLLSSNMRDLLPSATADPDGDAFLLVAFEFAPDGLRAITGVGPVLAVFDDLELRSIALATTENAITETRDLRFFGRGKDRIRFHLGKPSPGVREGWREKSAAVIRTEIVSEPSSPEDQGVLDVLLG